MSDPVNDDSVPGAPGESPEGVLANGSGSEARQEPVARVVARGAEPDPTAAEGASGYRVELPVFEGPLDLLLHLIQKHELDIINIPIAFITEKYLEHIKLMEDLSIDVASEYLVMAATLAYIKSRSLLPPSPEELEEGGDEAELDPRTELIRRLLEYQKYKLAAEDLGNRDVLGRDVFVRGSSFEPSAEPAPLAPVSMFQLMDAFAAVLARAKRLEDHQVDFERISITERISELSDILRRRGSARFEELFEEKLTRADLVVTFLALLEMTRLRMTRLRQDRPFEPIYVELAVTEDEPSIDEMESAVLEEPGVDAEPEEEGDNALARRNPAGELEPGIEDPSAEGPGTEAEDPIAELDQPDPSADSVSPGSERRNEPE